MPRKWDKQPSGSVITFKEKGIFCCSRMEQKFILFHKYKMIKTGNLKAEDILSSDLWPIHSVQEELKQL